MVLAPNRIPVVIEYCAPCEYLPQAIELSHVLLFDFQPFIEELRLVPASEGKFNVFIAGEQVHSAERSTTFPKPEEMKREFRTRLERLTGFKA